VGHGSWVTRVMGQLIDGSHGSRVKKCDPLSSLMGWQWRHSIFVYNSSRAMIKVYRVAAV